MDYITFQLFPPGFLSGGVVIFTAPQRVPWSGCTMGLVLLMSETTGWDYYLSASGRKLVDQNLSYGLLLLHHNQISHVEALQTLLHSPWGEI